jgi:hypothetical protein
LGQKGARVRVVKRGKWETGTLEKEVGDWEDKTWSVHFRLRAGRENGEGNENNSKDEWRRAK